MRLARVGPAGGERPALVEPDGTLRDLSGVVAELDGPALALLTQGEGPLADVDPATLPVVPAGERIGAPLARPGKVVGIGLNYACYARAVGAALPSEPVVFLKTPGSVVGPHDPIRPLRGSTTTDHEVELGVVIGAVLSEEEDPEVALRAVAGYVLANDVTDRGRVFASPGPWAAGKSADSFTPTGPWLVTPDELDPADVRLALSVNRVTRQVGHTADMAFGVGQILAHLSQLMTLEPGDLVLTGTPAGVAVAAPEPRPYLHPGDVVRASADVLGTQVNHVESREGTIGTMNDSTTPTSSGDVGHLDVLFRADRAIVDGAERAASVGVKDGRIVVVADRDADLTADEVVELAEDEVLLPGLVDTHVHVNEPGRTEWEGFDSATRAAAAGGVTTIIDMPLNSIPSTVTVEALREKQQVARDQAFVDVGFWGGAVPDHIGDIEALHEAGVFGFKCFLADSGVEEFPHLEPEQFAAAMDETARVGALMIVHAEDSATLAGSTPASGAAYSGFLGSRPTDAETVAVDRVIAEARRTGGKAHVLHLSAAPAIPALRAAKADGVDISVESCPHYLTLTSEDIPDGATQFKCCPPIREHDNQDALWEGLQAGDIDIVVSDHSPSTVDLKRFDTGDFGTAWGGIASVQLGLSAMWNDARERGVPLTSLVQWMATGPADRVGLTRKGRIAEGADADLVVFAPEDEWDVDVSALKHKNPVSAYADKHLFGQVRQTWLRGTLLTDETAPLGRLLERGDA